MGKRAGVGLGAALAVLVVLACMPARIRVGPGTEVVRGQIAPGFEGVADEFRRNFTDRGEYGAACCVYYRGEKVVDLWGGFRDIKTRVPWQENTMVLVFSTTKGLAAMCLALCHSRGWLDYDRPVSFYWPEFRVNAKGGITVRELLNHEAGLSCLDVPVTVRDIENLDSLAAILARQKPAWDPGMKHGYHAATLGLYVNELVRRIDPEHRSLGRFFQDEIAGPLGIEFYVGLPDSVPDSRLARVVPLSPVLALFKMPWRLVSGFLNSRSLLYRSVMIPKGANANSRLFLRVEQPSANGIGEVRAIARAYSEFATGGKMLGLDRRTLDELEASAIEPPAGPMDAVLGESTYYRLGFSKPGPDVWFGSGEDAYGMPGLGGSIGFADPNKEMGFAYVPIRLGYNLSGDSRRIALTGAVYRCIERLEGPEKPGPDEPPDE